MSKSKHTPGPYWWRLYANEPEDVERARALGIEPVRMLTNEGQIALMAGAQGDSRRVALVDCQTNFKRGQGYKTECAERDANARLIAAAPDLFALAVWISNYYANQDMNHQDFRVAAKIMADKIIAKAEGAQ